MQISQLEEVWLAFWPPVWLGDDVASSSSFLLFLIADEDVVGDDDKCKKSIEFGNDTGSRNLRGRGKVDELYELIDGTIEGERPSDDDDDDSCGIITRPIDDDGGGDDDNDDRRKHRKRLSQSLIKPCDTLTSCSFNTRNDGRTSGQCAQHFLITWN